MDDDLNVSAALAQIHEHVTAGNNALANNDHVEARRAGAGARGDVRRAPVSIRWPSRGVMWKRRRRCTTRSTPWLSACWRRAQARAQDWVRADALRDSLTQAGIMVEDSAEAYRWKVGGDRG